MPASVKGAVALRKSLRQFTPDLAKALPKEVAAALKPITKSAKGYLPDNGSVLSGWLARENSQARFPSYDAKIAKAGIGYKTTPSKPNRRGFRSLAACLTKAQLEQSTKLWGVRLQTAALCGIKIISLVKA